MHARNIIAVSIMAFGLNAGLVQAQPNDRDDRERRQDQRHEQSRQKASPSRDAHQSQHQAKQQTRPQARRGEEAQRSRDHRETDRRRGAGPQHSFHKGDRLPADYRSRHYVIDDWRGHKLSAPPRGQHWVQVGVDYVLIAIATGVITQIVLDH